MSEIFNIEKNYEYLKQGSLIGLIIVVAALFLSYYDLLKYVNVQLGGTIQLFLWIYLILNVGVANILKQKNSNQLPDCPKCKTKLEIDSYKCKNCGKLHFKKK